MTLYVWPHRLLRPSTPVFPAPVARVTQGPPALSGVTEVNASDGGGYWRLDLQDVYLGEWDQVRAWKAWRTHLQGGARPFIMPLPALGVAPRPMRGGALALPGPAAPGTDWFSWEPGFAAAMISAQTDGAATAGDASIAIEMLTGGPLLGGETFSADHSTESWRTYEIGRVTDVTGATYTVDISPPLRDDIANDAAIEFDVPRCVMALDPASPGDLGPQGKPWLRNSVSAGFVEWFGDLS